MNSTVLLLLPILACALHGNNRPIATADRTFQDKVSESQTAAASANRLASVKRVYVESFGDDPESRQVQSLIVDALTHSGAMIVTENKEKADAILKGVALQTTHQEAHSSNEGTLVGSGRGVAGIRDSSASTETIKEASISVRLVSPDGDVIWTCSKESKGGKYMGASADAADQIVKQLEKDLVHSPG